MSLQGTLGRPDRPFDARLFMARESPWKLISLTASPASTEMDKATILETVSITTVDVTMSAATDTTITSPGRDNLPDTPFTPQQAGPQEWKVDIKRQSEEDADSDASHSSPATSRPSSPVDSEGRPVRLLVEKAARHLDNRRFFDAYTKMLSDREGPTKPDPKVKASELVNGLVDYVRVLEDRITKLEERDSNATPDPKPPLQWLPPQTAQDYHRAWHPDEELRTVFFDAAFGSLDATGEYKNVHGADQGHYLSTYNPGPEIRVLYKRLDTPWGAKRDQGHEDRNLDMPDEEPPSPDDIDILAIGITSAPIISCICLLLDEPTFDRCSLRIGKPFRPILRLLSRIRSHQQSLKEKFE